MKLPGAYSCTLLWFSAFLWSSLYAGSTETAKVGKPAKLELYINLHLFYDVSLLGFFKNDEDTVKEFVLANAYSAYLSYTNSPLDKFAQFTFIIQSVQLVDPKVTVPNDMDGDQYRRNLQNYYRWKMKDKFTALVLFTYENFLYKSSKTDTQGLAVIGSGCGSSYELGIIVQARSYRTAFIFAHELGHSIGLRHDEDLGCGSGHIMSVGTGPGKNRFSRCSFDELTRIFTSLFASIKKEDKDMADCFRFKGPRNRVAVFPNNESAPYRNVPLEKQCKMGLGNVFKSILSANICARLTCSNGLIQIYSNPALENTTCDGSGHKFCRGGRCR